MLGLVDLIIRGGRIVDGIGNPWFRGDVAVVGGQIAALGRLDSMASRNTLAADGLVVCPGFIDAHTHSDLMLLAEPEHEAKLRQGVTTEILGQDGLSYAPLSQGNLRLFRRYLSGLNGDPPREIHCSNVGAFLDQFDRQVAVNVAYLVPHGALRYEVMGMADRRPTMAELHAMEDALSRALTEGAAGLSTALTYPPCVYADADELVALGRVVAAGGGCLVVHLRSTGDNCLDPIREVVGIAERADVAVHISHLKTRAGRHGRACEMVALIEEARDRGLDITFDTYPYGEGSGFLLSLLPGWIFTDGLDALEKKLSSPQTRGELRAYFSGREGIWADTIIAGGRPGRLDGESGKTIAELAAESGRDPVDFVCDLLLEEGLFVSTKSLGGPPEADLVALMRSSAQMVGSDGLLVGRFPHPRAFGTYGRYLGKYVREKKVVRLEDAIRRMTSFPAQRFGLVDRGVLRPGMAADLTVFDPDLVTDRADWDHGRRFTEGVRYVLVNGEIVLDEAGPTGNHPGRALRPGRSRGWNGQFRFDLPGGHITDK